MFKKKTLSKKREKLVSSSGSYYLFMCTSIKVLIFEIMKMVILFGVPLNDKRAIHSRASTEISDLPNVEWTITWWNWVIFKNYHYITINLKDLSKKRAWMKSKKTSAVKTSLVDLSFFSPWLSMTLSNCLSMKQWVYVTLALVVCSFTWTDLMPSPYLHVQ